jgi:Putative beta-barrel porin-2, OmpL-like. bbp2
MRVFSKCCWTSLVGLALTLPGLAQTNSTSDAQTSSLPAVVSSAGQQAPEATTQSATSTTVALAAPADPQPLPMPSMSGPLQTAVPREFAAGPFGKLAVTGILSGMALTQANRVPGDKQTQWDLSNGQIFLQKTTGWWQFYLQAGAYNIPALGTPFLSTVDTVKNIYGPFPQGYLKLVKGNYSVEVGALPTLIGAEYTFSFENINTERGILWNQENAVNRGVQLNGTFKKLSASLSLNDGFYSNRYTWLSGSLTYAFNGSNSLSFVGAGNAGQYAKNTLVTPLFLNNSQIYNVIYTYSHEHWMVQPYFQYTNVPTNAKIGIPRGAATRGGALLLTYNFKYGISLAARPEYISSTGSVSNGAINLLYGPGSGAFAFTATPTYRKDGFFLRGELSIVHATSSTPGDVFGPTGLSVNQPRGLVEAGFMF